jgi:hypothetical protein
MRVNHLTFVLGNILILMGFLVAFGVINLSNLSTTNIVAGFVFVIAGSYLDLHGRGGR